MVIPSATMPTTVATGTRSPRMQGTHLVTLLDHSLTAGDRHHALSFLIATTGLRRAEALALRWSDLDLDQARLTIRQTVTVANGVIVLQRDAKSDDSERTIALDTRTIIVLNEQHCPLPVSAQACPSRSSRNASATPTPP